MKIEGFTSKQLFGEEGGGDFITQRMRRRRKLVMNGLVYVVIY